MQLTTRPALDLRRYGCPNCRVDQRFVEGRIVQTRLCNVETRDAAVRNLSKCD
jgi:hypothetical protein